ncbi:MAG: RNA polymerase sigma factor [Planctomycetaceae bacterium]
MNIDESQTSVSLLMKLRRQDQDQQAWDEFVNRYGPRIHAWCLARRLQHVDADDVTQEVLAKLARQLRTFDYDASQSFRGWLRRITQNALADFWRDRRSDPTAGHRDGMRQALDTAEARNDLSARLNDAFDIELFEEAAIRVQRRVTEDRFAAWRLTAVDQVTGKEAATRLNMPVASVYTAKNQVRKLIQEEIQVLETGQADA